MCHVIVIDLKINFLIISNWRTLVFSVIFKQTCFFCMLFNITEIATLLLTVFCNYSKESSFAHPCSKAVQGLPYFVASLFIVWRWECLSCICRYSLFYSEWLTFKHSSTCHNFAVQRLSWPFWFRGQALLQAKGFLTGLSNRLWLGGRLNVKILTHTNSWGTCSK